MSNSLDIFDGARGSFLSLTSQNNFNIQRYNHFFLNITEALFSKLSGHWGLGTTKQSGVLRISNFRALAEN